MLATLDPSTFELARANVARHARRTPLLGSRSLSEATGFDVHLKAEVFQRTGSYKLRGPLNKLALLSPDERARGVVCSSAGNHAQGVALAAALFGVPAVVVMAENATPTKVEATRGYGAEVVLHGSIWDDANEKALEIVEERELTYVHPFDDLDLIAGQGSVGLEILDDLPDVDVVVVPIGGGGLISGVSAAVKSRRPDVAVVGVESEGAPAMKLSVESGRIVTLDRVDCRIDGLTVRRVGENTLAIVRRFVDEIVTLPDERISDALLWTMSRTKVVVEAAAAATSRRFSKGGSTRRPGPGAGARRRGPLRRCRHRDHRAPPLHRHDARPRRPRGRTADAPPPRSDGGGRGRDLGHDGARARPRRARGHDRRQDRGRAEHRRRGTGAGDVQRRRAPSRRGRRGLDVKDGELLVLRHELAILRRQVPRPKLRPVDRALLAAAPSYLPRPSRGILLVT